MESYTHEQWHNRNKITYNQCAICQQHGRIITDKELLEKCIMTKEFLIPKTLVDNMPP